MKIGMELQPIFKDKTGIGWYTYNIIKEVIKLDKDNEFIGYGFNFAGRNNILPNIKDLNIEYDICKVIPYGLYSRLWDYIPIKYNNFFRNKADIYHFFNFIVPPNIGGIVIVTVYDVVYKRFPETMTKANFNRLEKNLQRSVDRADIIITISENSKKEIIEYLNVAEDKIRIIPIGIEIEKYRKKYSENEMIKVRKKYNIPNEYILYLGTLEPRKNIETIIDSYALYKKNGGNLKLVIAGKKGWMYDSILNRVKQYSLGDEVIFTGYVDEDDKACIYKMSSLFLFPSFYEGFGIPVIEAMAAGTPVITSNTSSLPEAAGDAAIFVNPKDINAIADSMLKIANNDYYKKELIIKGLKQSEKFSWEKSAEKLINIYNEFDKNIGMK
ncbi:Glycosyltransferase involved in cell wall bisynthesis [Caloramator quimbayensis]|uniref:Glycosyltransferase involved in cell wall bisynthesis n=1 Tax=Caloramator quimbayensis TaxID=1147123 RepID=A0A1T4WI22_9CLOT|nr:glycosyltransferase family 1 protein [Caloramator quimbayensis]SKA76588.1 Glycosyltransferase involved in cell wall bisynthesis [Caloramator quimbayensis]